MSLQEHVENQNALVLQPRMGFGRIADMRNGMAAVAELGFPAVRTITVDSKTRQNQVNEANEALRSGEILNGFPLVSYDPKVVVEMIKDSSGPNACPVQVRHGSPDPRQILRAATHCGIEATEGGPVSYCLPYGRTALQDSVRAWRQASEQWAESWFVADKEGHIESFGGCLMGQLCHPSLLIAVSLLECLFFRQLGVRSVSLSLAQGYNAEQDIGALLAMRRLATRLLGNHDWHVVFYTFMGMFPETEEGALQIIRDSAAIAREGMAARLIVKTAEEAHRIPRVSANVNALRVARSAFFDHDLSLDRTAVEEYSESIYLSAKILVEAALGLSDDLGTALAQSFQKGILDIPFCGHPDNRGESSCRIDDVGAIQWDRLGSVPLTPSTKAVKKSTEISGSSALLRSLQYNRNRYDKTTTQHMATK